MGLHRLIRQHLIPVGLLLGLLVYLISVNWRVETYVTGVDNFHIEFDLGLAWKRAINGVWQSNQGLGLVTGLAQATELPRIILYYVLHIFVPVMYMRQVYLFGCLALGAFGAYVLGNALLKNKWSAFIVGVFYLTNLATVQTFFMPTEMFVTQYGFLPWLIFAFFGFLRTGQRKWLVSWLVVLFLALPQAMTPTIFVIELVFFGIGSLVYLWHKKNWQGLVAIWIGTLIINAYWLLPFSYFTLTQSENLIKAKINQIFSTENYLTNRARAGIGDVLSLKGMWFDYPDFDGSEMVPLMQVWNKHLTYWGWLVFLFGLGGVVSLFLFVKESDWRLHTVGISGLLLTLILITDKWRLLPLVAEAFRTPFTKVSVLLALMLALALGKLLTLFGKSIVLRNVLGMGIILLMMLMSLPMWRGHLVNRYLYTDIPRSYFELFDYLNSLPEEKRIVHLPAHAAWSWDYRDWGYRGSGFLWYGIKQPILDRAFDVWSPYNETFYNEFSTVLYSCEEVSCAGSVERVLQKYNVSLALLDESIIVPNGNQEQLQFPLIRQVMTVLGGEPVFREGKLTLWSIGPKEEVSVAGQWREIDAENTYSRVDPWFNFNNPYIHSENGTVYPLAGLSREKPKLEVSNGLAVIKTQTRSGNFLLAVPPIPTGTKFAGRARLVFDKQEVRVRLLPLAELTSGGKTYPVWLDQEWVVQLSAPLSNVVVGVNGSYQFVKTGESVELGEIPLVAGQPVEVDVFDAGQGQQIRTSRLGMIEKDSLIKHNYADKKTCIGVESFDYKCLPERAGFVKTRETGIHWFDILGEEITKPFEAVVYPQIAMTIMDEETWNLIRYEWDNVESGNLVVKMPVEIRKLAAEGKGDNCDVLKRGRVLKKTINIETEYQAEKYGALCDGLTISDRGDLVNQLVVKLNGENKKGRGLKASIYSDMQNRTVIESLLSPGKFEEYLGLWPVNANEQFSMTLETRSFGSVKSVNTVTSMESFNLPLSWLQEIALIKEMAPKAGNYGITNLTKSGTWKYSVELSGQGDGLVTLHQGFDPGWVAYQGQKKLHHVKVNGWANGWIIPDDANNRSVTIFYWPQLLEWLGLGLFLIVGGFGWIILRKI